MLGVVVGITAMAWSVSAEREFRYKMPEVCLSNMSWESIGGSGRKLKADMCWNSLTDSHLRDTGRSRFASTRLHRRLRPAARDPHRAKQSSKDPMWNYGVFGIQRDERLWERTFCTYAKKRIDKFHQRCSAGSCDGMYVARDWIGVHELTAQCQLLW